MDISNRPTEPMKIWGIGPKFAFFSFLYFIFVLILHHIFYPLFVIEIIPYTVLQQIRR